MATKTKDWRRKKVNTFLVENKIGQFCTQVRYNKRRNSFRAFLCTYWKGGNILDFTFYLSGGFQLCIISTKNDREEIVEVLDRYGYEE